MQIERAVKTVADLLLLVLLIVLALQLLSPPQIRTYSPPQIEADPGNVIQPSQPARGIISGYADQPVSQDQEEINYTAPYFKMEQSLFSKVNSERASENLPKLVWNDAVAAVARGHSENLAKENELRITRFTITQIQEKTSSWHPHGYLGKHLMLIPRTAI